MHTDLTFGTWLRQKRKEKGLTQETLAGLASCSTTYLKKIEAGQRQPTRQVVEALLDALEAPKETQPTYIGLAFAANPRAKPSPTTNLPHALTSFIGRETELGNLMALLQRKTVRLVTLMGPGGVGKTRLALQAAGQQSGFRDGVYFVNLAPIADPSLAPHALISGLDLRDSAGRQPLDAATDHLRVRNVLLGLDNCEHLIEACSQLAHHLLTHCLELRILATSREALGIAGEVAYPVPTLALPDPNHLPPLDALSRYDGVRLFAERAAAVQPQFSLTNSNASAVAQICYRLDGLPLAIELAAARMRAFSPEQIAARLDDRFRLLTGGSRVAMERQHTLRAAIEWSYSLLSEAERTVFRRLAVFAGGWTLEAAEHICAAEGLDPPDILALLAQLVNKSMVTTEAREADMRYGMLETLREYAREKLLASAEADALHSAHARFFLTRAEEAKPPLPIWLEWDWVRRVGVEADNFRAALAWTAEHEETEIFTRLVAALWEYWFFARQFAEGAEWTRRALDVCQPPELAKVRADLLLGSATFAFARGDYGAQRMHAEAALRAGYELGDDRIVATAYIILALHAHYQADDEAALAWAEQALALFLTLGDKLGATWSRIRAGNYACRLRQDEIAEVYWNAVLAEAQPAGWTGMILQAIDGQATLARLQGNYARAEAKYREVLALYLSAQFGSFANMTLNNLGHVVLRQGRHVEAAALFSESLQCRPVGPVGRDLPPPLTGLAGVRAREGRALAAARLIGGVERVLADSGDHLELEERLDYEAILADIRSRLSDAEFNAAWAEGHAMTPEQLVTYALTEQSGG